MIWIVPFIWALILKALSKSAPSSYEVENKKDPESFGGRNTMWTNS